MNTVKLFGIFLGFICATQNVVVADTLQMENELQKIESEIKRLETEYENKTTDLAACQKKAQNLKTAGITTLAVTGAGVVANVALYKKYSANKSGSGGIGGGSFGVVNKSQEQKDADSCAEGCEIDKEWAVSTAGCDC